jgi:hypothetical protein
MQKTFMSSSLLTRYLHGSPNPSCMALIGVERQRKRENYSGGRRLMGSGTSKDLPITSAKIGTEALKLLRAFQSVL